MKEVAKCQISLKLFVQGGCQVVMWAKCDIMNHDSDSDSDNDSATVQSST